MALELSTKTSTGFDCNYWRILEITFNLNTSQSHVVIALYKDIEARAGANEPVLIKEYGWNLSQYPFTASAMKLASPIHIAYDKLKTLPEFTAANDV